jgi:HlyD family secretion protein
MARKYQILILLIVVILLGTPLTIYFLSKESDAPELLLAKAVRRQIMVAVSTNGKIEPADYGEIYAPVDGLVAQIYQKEGSEIEKGQPLMRLESERIRTALSDAKAALLQERRQARTVLSGPSKEEMAALDASIAENELQLNQQKQELTVEESLYSKGATTRASLENLRKECDLLQLRLDGLKQKKQSILSRYSPEDKEWEQDKISELTKQVKILEQQLQMESVVAPTSGLIYAVSIRQGSFAAKGQLLAQIYQPGRIRLRAYVDEPDLGRIEIGQQVLIEWDGLPDRKWTGTVEKTAKQVVPVDNRSVGLILCMVDGNPKELIPNLNVKVEIVTARKESALVVPRAAVFSHEGHPAVLVSDGKHTEIKTVVPGLLAPDEIEIVSGIAEGSSIVTNPAEVK